jgi:hypothetical protein
MEKMKNSYKTERNKYKEDTYMNFEITNKRPNNYPGFADLPE